MRIKKISAVRFRENNNFGNKEFEFHEILGSIPVPIFIKDRTGIFTNCNKAYEKFMGLRRDEIIGKSVYDIAPKNLADQYTGKDRELFAQGTVQVYESMITAKGIDRYALFHKSIYRSAVGEIQGLVGTIIDITEQKKAEQLLKQRIAFENVVSVNSVNSVDSLNDNADIDTILTERKRLEEEIYKLSLVIEQSPGEIVITDMDQKIVYFNSKFSQKYGYTLEELKGHNISLIMSGLQSDEFYGDLNKTISTGNEWRGEICGRGKSGEIFWTLVSVSQFRKLDGEATNYISMGQDITEKKIMEETLEKQSTEIKNALANLKQTQMQLVQQEKLAGIGQLAAGVAHEINNPLGFVLSNFDSLKKYLTKITDAFHKYGELKNKVLESDTQNLKELAQQLVVFEKQKKIAYIFEDLEPIIQESDDGLQRLGEIVKALKLFSRVDKNSEFECYDLNTGIKNTLIIAKNEIKYVAEIEVALGEVPEIQASAGQINQVLLNIIINAAHAIKEKQMDKLGMVRITSYHDEQFIYCSIQDDGLGMTAETMKDIFNAFFTTKPSGQGTGLGLSISYDIIVNKHCGDISVISEKGIGTTFTIKLPLAPSHKPNDK